MKSGALVAMLEDVGPLIYDSVYRAVVAVGASSPAKLFAAAGMPQLLGIDV